MNYFKLYKDIFVIMESKEIQDKFNKCQYIMNSLISNGYEYKDLNYVIIKRAYSYINGLKKSKIEKRWLWLIRNKKMPYRIIYPFEYYCNEYTKTIKLDFKKIKSNFSYEKFKNQFEQIELEPISAISFDDNKKIIKTLVTGIKKHKTFIEYYTYLGRFIAYNNFLLSYTNFLKEMKKRRNSYREYINLFNMELKEIYPEIFV